MLMPTPSFISRPLLRLVLPLLALLTLLVPASVLAQSPKVFLNGVDITGVTGQSFEAATVTIDPQGNILIDAPQYKVEVQGKSGQAEAPKTTQTPGAIAGNYFLVVNNSAPGKVQYELDVYVNGALVRTIKDKQSQVVVEISDKLVRGGNKITVHAKKDLSTSRQSAASADAIDILVGKGSSAGNQLTIERQVMSFRVDASQTDDKSQDFTFDVN